MRNALQPVSCYAMCGQGPHSVYGSEASAVYWEGSGASSEAGSCCPEP